LNWGDVVLAKIWMYIRQELSYVPILCGWSSLAVLYDNIFIVRLRKKGSLNVRGSRLYAAV
jgi:hypothetical protein